MTPNYKTNGTLEENTTVVGTAELNACPYSGSRADDDILQGIPVFRRGESPLWRLIVRKRGVSVSLCFPFRTFTIREWKGGIRRGKQWMSVKGKG